MYGFFVQVVGWPVACESEVLAVTWQTGQGGAARDLLIIMGGAVCLKERVRQRVHV